MRLATAARRTIDAMLDARAARLGAYLTVLKIMGQEIGHRPLLILAVLLIVVGVQTLATGLIAELLANSNRAEPFVIRRVLRSATADAPRAGETSSQDSARVSASRAS